MVSIFKKKEQNTNEPQPVNHPGSSNTMNLDEQRLAVFERIAGDSNVNAQAFQIIVSYMQTAVDLPRSPESKRRMKDIAVKAKETLERRLGTPDAKTDVNAIKDMLLQLDQAIPKLS